MTRSISSSVALSLALALGAVAAQAQTIIVRCDTFPNRSRASVDGKDLAAGMYSAVLVSGDNRADSPMDAAVAGEVEFDFDSNAKDVAAGATKIGKHFIVGGQVVGKLLDASGTVVAHQTKQCKAH